MYERGVCVVCGNSVDVCGFGNGYFVFGFWFYCVDIGYEFGYIGRKLIC